jgi:hypothetical protein
MNYLKHYCNLIRKAENRTPPEGYTEKHHTFPKSIFGKNNRVVVLTAREHYIAHTLLERIYIKRYGIKDKRTNQMITAVICMKGNGEYYNSFLYEYTRKRFSNYLKNRPKTEEQKKKMAEKSVQRYKNMAEREKVSVQMKKYHKTVDRNGKNNPNYNRGCFYELISPEGIIGYTNKLVTFCQNNNLSRPAFCRIISNKSVYHKGWTIQKIT